MRSARSIHGRGGEAIIWANEVTEYINTQYTEVKLSVFTSRFGYMNNIYWYADVADLAALDRWQKQIGTLCYTPFQSSQTDFISFSTIFEVILMYF